jgi:Ca2+-transporting ATPase
MRDPLWRMVPLRENKPLIWTVLVGFATILVAFLIPGLRALLGIVPLTLTQWGLVAAIAFLLLVIVEIAKMIANRFHGQD